MEPVRACPICPECGSKRFERLPGGGGSSGHVAVRCRKCGKTILI